MLDGPNFIPKEPKSAIILCHGYGADGNDMFGLVPELSADLPNTAFFCPNAPDYTDFGGRQWFGLENYNPQDINKSIDIINQKAADAALTVRQYAAETCNYIGVPVNRLIIGGFSQGALMAMHTAYNWEKNTVAAVIAMSSVPPTGAQAINKVPTIVTHGMLDMTIPYTALDITKDTLGKLGISAKFIIRPEMGHAIDNVCIHSVRDFIKESFSSL